MVDTDDVDVRRVQELVGAIVDADVAHAAFHIADAATASLKSPQPSLDVFITELEGKLWKSADEIMTIKEVLEDLKRIESRPDDMEQEP